MQASALHTYELIRDIIPLAILIILAPGLLLNQILGRFQHAPHGFLDASIRDWLTWVVSMAVWTVLVFLWSKVKIRMD